MGYLASLSRIGKANAAVFPDPVSELMMMLLRASAEGMARAWMGVGVWYLIFWQVVSSQGESLRLLKDIT